MGLNFGKKKRSWFQTAKKQQLVLKDWLQKMVLMSPAAQKAKLTISTIFFVTVGVTLASKCSTDTSKINPPV